MRIRGQDWRIINTAAILIFVLLTAIFLNSRREIGDFSIPDGPRYEGSYAGLISGFDGNLKVVTWNLHHADKLEEIIQTLENVPELRDAEILLLQEVDLEGVETIAQRLHYNYVFYPATFNRQRKEENGNAILAYWPLTNPAKIVLPNFIPGWFESRNSARATVLIGSKEVIVYSVHMELTWMLFVKGVSQVEFIANEAKEKDNFIILGGDFNTWSLSSIANLVDRMRNAGLVRLTEGTGYTFEWAGRKLILDHIFSKAVLDYQAGVYRQTHASDHFPVWTVMKIGADQ